MHRRVSVCILMAVLAGCTLGPKHLKDGHLAYNEAVRTAADRELLLNIVRMRYLDSIEFLSTNSISSQLSFSVGIGAKAGTELGESSSLVDASANWSSNPTFTFTPQRGTDFAKMMMTPAPVELLAELAAADWDFDVIFRLMVQNANGLGNRTGFVSRDFVEAARLLGSMQDRADLHLGAIEQYREISPVVPATQVSGADLIEAAQNGFSWQPGPEGRGLVLSRPVLQPAIHIVPSAPERAALYELLRVEPEPKGYVEITRGARPGGGREPVESLAVEMRSVLDAIVFLSSGVAVPPEHLERGLTRSEYPVSGTDNSSMDDLFWVSSSTSRPDAFLEVPHRGAWFYIADDDVDSRTTFLVLSELLRLSVSPGEGKSPVLTLPVGGR